MKDQPNIEKSHTLITSNRWMRNNKKTKNSKTNLKFDFEYSKYN